jgi:autotransporter-associated beta strand protein
LLRPRAATFRKPDSRPRVEPLETRLAPATFTWTGAAGKDTSWSNGANWSGGVAPSTSDSPLDDIVFPGGTPAPTTFTPNDNIAGLVVNSLTISGSGYTLTANNNVSLTLGSPSVPGSGSLIAAGGVSSDLIAMNLVLNAPGGTGSRQFFIVNPNATLEIQGKLSGTTGVELTKEGTGTLILDGDNHGFTGPFTLDTGAGVVEATSSTALGSTSSVVTVGTNSQLQLSSATGLTVNQSLLLNGTGPDGLGALVNEAGTNTWAGSVQLDSDVTVGGAAGSTLTLSGVISDLGSGHGLTKEGAGTIALSGNNTYRGITTVNNGILDVESNTALGAADGTAATGTVVNSTNTETGTLQIDGNVTVSNELLTLNGAGFGGAGALLANTGNSTWAGDIILGSAAPYGSNVTVSVARNASLTVSGVAGAPVGTSSIGSPNGTYSLTKTGTGTLIFTTLNNYTGQTFVANGILEIEDSAALGTSSANVLNGATLELAVDSIPDSVTNNTASLNLSTPLTVNGDGFNNLGALYSHSGINQYSGTLTLSGGLGSIGVDPDATPTGSPYNYDITPAGTVLDDSLSITGVIVNFVNNLGFFQPPLEELVKFGNGQLILPRANQYEGPTNIEAGFVTLENARGLGARVPATGDEAQPVVSVGVGAALHLLPLTGNIVLPYNLNLTGLGAASAYPLVNDQGALMSLAGINSVSGNIVLSGQAGIGVEQIYSTTSGNVNFSTNAASQLTLLGQQSEAQPVLNYSVQSSGGTQENDNVIPVGTTSGTVTINATVPATPVDFQVWDGNETANPAGSFLLYDSTTNGNSANPTNQNSATITVNYTANSATASVVENGTPVGTGWNPGGTVTYGPLTATTIEIIVNHGSVASEGSQWSYTATVVPAAAVGGGITKLGSQRLILQGPGTYTGNVDIQQGVVLDQNNTGLGSGAGATIVESGAALELGNTTAPENGGVQDGLDVLGETLDVNGTGNTAFGDMPVTVLSGAAGATAPVGDTIVPSDYTWRGPVNLEPNTNPSVAPHYTFTVPTGARLTLFGTVDDGSTKPTPPAPADLTLTGGGEMDLAAANTYRGITHVNAGVLGVLNSQALGGTGISEVDNLSLTGAVANSTKFNLTFNNVTTATPITYTGTSADATNIAAALNALNTVQGLGGVVSVTQHGLVYSITFGGGLAGFPQTLTGALAPGSPGGGISVLRATAGSGGTIVASGASLSLEGNLSIAGEPLQVQGSGLASASSLTPQWFPIGPDSVSGGAIAGNGAVSGRVTGVAVDQSDPTGNTIYISTAGGGAWKTINGGQTWQPLFDGDAAIFSGAIAIAPSDPRVIYLGTGEANNSGDSFYGTGVYKSTDSGQTWTLLTGPGSANPLNGQAISSIVVDPNNPNLVYVASTYFLTTTGVASSSPENTPQTGGLIAGVYRYNGTSWFDLTDVLSANRNASGGVAGAPNTAGPDDDFRISFPLTGNWSSVAIADGWLYAALGTYTGNNNNGVFRCINPNSNNPLWYVGNGSPLVAPNGQPAGEFPTGATGSAVNGNIKIVAVAVDIFPQDNVLYAAISTPFNGASGLLEIVKSTTGGQSWAATANQPPNYMGIEGYQVNAIALVNPNTVYVAGEPPTPTSQTMEVYETPDGGTTWNDVSLDTNNDGPGYDEHAMAIDANGNLVMASGAGVFRYTPGPAGALGTWADLNGNLDIGTYNDIDVSPNDPNFAIAGSQDVGINLYTGDPEWTWVNQGRSNGGQQVAINPNNPNIIYAVGDGTLYESTTGGTAGSWNPIYVPGGYGIPFVLDPNNTQRLLVGDGPLEESLDGGATFQNNLNSPTQDVTAVAIAGAQGAFSPDPSFTQVNDIGANTYDPNTIYVSDGTNVWVTKNDGLNWATRTSNLPILSPGYAIQNITVDPRDRDVAYLVINSPLGYDAGNGGRVFETTNAGQTWINITHNLPNVPAWALTIDPRNGQLYVGNDLGVYTSTNAGQTWTRFGAGLPEVQVTDIVLNMGLNTLTVSTYGRGAFQLFLDGTQANGGAFAETSGSSVWTGPVFLTGATSFGASGTQVIHTNLATAQINIIGTIADLVPGANNYVTKTGPGNVVFSGANSYGGTTEVQQGALVVHNTLALGSISSPTIVDNGAALDLASSVTGESLILNGNGASTFNGHSTGALENVANNNTYSGPITLASSATIGVDSGSTLTVTGAIGDGGGHSFLIKELTGTLTLQGTDTYGGNTTVNQGVLNIQNSSALGRGGATTTVVDGAQLQLQDGIDVANESLDLSGTGIFNTGALESVGGANTWAGSVVLDQVAGQSPTTNPPSNIGIGVLNTAPGDELLLTGMIGQNPSLGSAALGITKVGPGLLILDNNNTYQGVTNVTAGTLRIQQAGALGTPTNGTVVQNGATLEIDGGGGGFTVAGEPLTLNGVGGGQGALSNIAGTNGWSGPITLQTDSTIGTAAGTSLTVSGAVQDPTPPTVPAPAFTKLGDGRLALTAADTYTGPTAVNGGVLNIQNSFGLGVPVNEVQTITLTGSLTAGSATVTIGFSSATPVTVPTASLTGMLLAGIINGLLSSLGINGAVDVTQSGGTFTVTFDQGAVAGVNQPQLVVSAAGGAVAAVATTRDGSKGTVVAGGATLQLQGGIDVSNEALTISGVGAPTVQAVALTGNAAGTFRLTFNGQSTPLLSATATAQQVQSALNALSTIGPNGVTVTLIAGTYYVVFNGGNLASADQSLLVAAGGGGAIATVASVRHGAEGALDSLSGANTDDGSITLAPTALGAPTAIGADSGSTLTIDQGIGQSPTTSPAPLIKEGSGVLLLDGLTSNAYTGLTTVANGTLLLDKTGGALAIQGGLTVGTGALPPGSATARLEGSNEIANGQALVVNSDGVFDLNGNTQGFASLAMTGGSVELTGAASQLTVTGGVTATSDGATPANPASVTGAGTLTLGANAPIVTVTGSGLASSAPNMVIAVPITTPNSALGFTQNGTGGDLRVTSNNPSLPVTVASGRLLADGDPNVGNTFGAVSLTGGTIGGHGSVFSITPTSGTIQPAEDSATPTTLTTTTTATQTWNSHTTLSLVLNDAAATDYSVLALNGNLNLGGASLAGFAGAGVHVNDQLAVVVTTGTITGSFATITDPYIGQQVVFVGGEEFQYSIQSAAGFSEVLLTRIQAHATVNLKSSGSPSTYGQDVTLTATVTPSVTGAGAISNNDTVTFTLTSYPASYAAVVASLSGPPSETVPTNNGVAVFDPNNFFGQPLTVGAYTFAATFNGDNVYNANSATPVNQVVTQATTNFSLSANTTTPVPGQPVTVTASFFPMGGGAGVPTGTATFSLDGAAITSGVTLADGVTPATNGQVTLQPNGQAVIVFTSLTTLPYTIGVSYPGDTNFTNVRSTSSNALSINVVKGTASIQISANPTSSPYGQNVGFTATLTGPVLPVGPVTFYKDSVGTANVIGTGTSSLASGGQVSINYNLLGAGAHTIIAAYGGSTSYNASMASVPFTVSQAGTALALSSPLGTTAFGQNVTITASLSVTPSGGVGSPTGTVTFYDTVGTTKTQLGSSNVNAGGLATILFASPTVGTNTITAVYSGDGNFLGSNSSNSLIQTVDVGVVVKGGVSGNNLNTVVFNQPITLTASVMGQAGGSSVVPGNTETVTFTDTGTMTTLGTATLTGGIASLPLTNPNNLAPGNHVIQVSYAGNVGAMPPGNLLPGSSTFTLTVNPGMTSTSASAPGTATFGVGIAISATVGIAFPSSGTLTGTVTFFDGAPAAGKTPLGTSGLTGNVASISHVTSLGVGTHLIYAVYNYNNASDPDFATSTGNALVTVSADSTTTSLTVPSLANYYYSVPLTLTVSVAANHSAAVPTGSVTFTDNGIAVPIAAVPLVNGVATVVVNAPAPGGSGFYLKVGSNSLVANYAPSTSPSQNFTSSSGSNSVTVAQDGTTTTLPATLPQAYVGQPLTYTATVAAQNGGTLAPNGTVTFYDTPFGGIKTQIGSAVPVASNGTAVFVDTAGLAFGHGAQAHTITATYTPATNTPATSPATNFTTSSTTASQDVLNNDAVTVNISPGIFLVYGQAFTLTATITSVPPSGQPTPSGAIKGMVTFYDTFGGSTTPIAGPIAVNAAGTATTTVPPLAGPVLTPSSVAHFITATFTADPVNSDFVSKTSPALLVASSKAGTTTLISDNLLGPYFYGQALTVTATVKAQAPGAGTPTGTVYFYDMVPGLPNAYLGSASLSGGQATLSNFPPLAANETHTVTAVYGADTNFLSSSVPSTGWLQVAVSAAVTTISITGTAGSPAAPVGTTFYGEPVNLTASVAVANGGGMPIGTVTFTDLTGGNGVLANVPITASSNGVATISVSSLLIGSHKIAALFTPASSNYVPSNTLLPADTSLPVTVTQATPTITVTPSTGSVFLNDPVAFFATVGPQAGGTGVPTGSVQFFLNVDPTLDPSAKPFATVPLSGGVAASPALTFSVSGNNLVVAVYVPATTENRFTAGTPFKYTFNPQAQVLGGVQVPQQAVFTQAGAPTAGVGFNLAVFATDSLGNRDYAANAPPYSVTVSVVTGPATGSWTANFGPNVPGVAYPTITLPTAGTYTLLVDVTDGNGNHFFDTISLTAKNRQT